MDTLKKIQNIKTGKPYNGFSVLSKGYHEIIFFRLVKNKYGDEGGKTILVELKNEVLFLPQYFTSLLNEEDIDNLNKCNETMYLYFGGKKEKSK